MLLIYCCCIRKSYIQNTIPLPPSIFNPLNEPRPPSYSSYGAIGDLDDSWTNGGSSTLHFFAMPSNNRPLGYTQHHSNFNYGDNDSTTTLRNSLCCCCYNRRPNQYRLWRLARLVAALPAVLLLTSLLMEPLTSIFTIVKLVKTKTDVFLTNFFLLDYVNGLRNPTAHMCCFLLIYVTLMALM